MRCHLARAVRHALKHPRLHMGANRPKRVITGACIISDAMRLLFVPPNVLPRFIAVAFFIGVACSPPRAQRIGILFGSFGDVESCQCVNSYFKGALQRLVGYEIPVHDELERRAIADLVWSASKKETFDMYRAAPAPAAARSELCAPPGTPPSRRSATRRSSRARRRRARRSRSSCGRWALTPRPTPPTTL